NCHLTKSWRPAPLYIWHQAVSVRSSGLGAMEKMQFQANTALRSYALALLFFAAVFALRLLIDYVVPDRLPFITFFPAVLAAAYYCGLRPSILLLLLSAITGTIWSDPTGASPIGFYIAS